MFVPSFDLLHKRLGHPSYFVMYNHKDILFYSSISNTCRVCLQAKQTRTSFPLSENKASIFFDLVHCDVWVLTVKNLPVNLLIFLLSSMIILGCLDLFAP